MLLAGGVAVLGLENPAQAAFPGKNGKIVFQRSGVGFGIYTINPDGSGLKRISDQLTHPDLSPDGKKIAFLCTGGICVKNLATGRVRVVTDIYDDEDAILSHPVWSPDGTKIAFSVSQIFLEEMAQEEHIYVVNADGSNQREHTDTYHHEAEYTVWSPDGNTLVFQGGYEDQYDLWATNADGGLNSNLRNLTNTIWESHERYPDWAPSGKKIVFAREDEEYEGTGDVWKMDADGSNQQQLTNTPEVELTPIWAPAGGKILFQRDGDLFTMSSADGSNQTNITNTPDIREWPTNWQRRP
jgi:Tol biopolymer transport system component